MHIIGLANQKGGVGKTTFTINLAVIMARQGYKVVVIDADPQSNTTAFFTHDTGHSGLFNLILLDLPASKIIQPVPSNIGLIGGTDCDDALFLSANRRQFSNLCYIINRCLNQVQPDIVFMDTPPTRIPAFAQLLFSCSHILVPTQLEHDSLVGINLMASTIADITKKQGTGPQLLGILPNHTRRTREHIYQLQQLDAIYGPTVWPPTAQTITVSEARSRNMALIDYAPGEPVTHTMRTIANRLVAALRL